MKKDWLDDPANVTKLVRALFVVCGALVVAGFLVHIHGHFDFETWPAFYGVFGFVTFFGMVLAGKHLRRLLMRDEDYYDDGE